ncbi:hypothetical protein, partial [Paenibacillus sp. 32352]|uniref:hypothetical protein n=1 Tax=Paenibacillus sp. 32352 TaxID=1969111 RepID=UPI001C4E189A
TRTLSLPASMVLGPKGPGRVERRQAMDKALGFLRLKAFLLYTLLYFYCCLIKTAMINDSLETIELQLR